MSTGGRLGGRERMNWIAAIALAVASRLPFAGSAQEVPVDLELALAVDGSGSIDAGEFNLQIDGIAAAFRDPAFHAALRQAAPDGIAVTLVQWTGQSDQAQVVPWTHVVDADSAAAFADLVLAAGRHLPPGPTGIGSAIRFSYRLMEGNGFAGKRQVIDVSGDGYNNSGNRPELARDEAAARGIVINGLTVLNDIPLLDRYFTARVIAGPGAFVVQADDFADFAAAFRLKLIREVTGYTIGQSDPAVPPALDNALFAIRTAGRDAPMTEGAQIERLKPAIED